VTVVVNGQDHAVEEGTTVADLVTAFAPAGIGDRVAVARNAELVPRSTWATTVVADGDHFELLSAVQGG
jgi:sulfur carrier protein